MFQIVSDGSCDFSTGEAASSKVEVVPFYITLDGEHFQREGIELKREEFIDRITTDKNLFPKTSQPNPQDYIDVYEPYLKEGKDILTVTISSKLSGSHRSAVLAIQMMQEEYPDRKILLLDSLSASLGQGIILREVIKMRDAGLSIDETLENAKKIVASTSVYFTLETLDYLKKGGRVGPTTAFVGSVLGLKPILHVVEGQVSQLDNVRGRKKALELIEEALVEALKDQTDKVSIVVGHILCEGDVISLHSSIESALKTKITNPICDVGATIATHTGPGALAFAYCRTYESL